MTDTAHATEKILSLPSSVVTRVDVSRLVREVEWVDNEITTAAVRAKAGVQAPAQPVLSDQLTEFLAQNQLTLTDAHERTKLIKTLRHIKDSVPIIHMTFATPADRESLQQLAQWLRSSVHPQAVIAVGLQPGLVGGVYVRTPNQVYDLSLRAKLQGSRGVLIKSLEALRGES